MNSTSTPSTINRLTNKIKSIAKRCIKKLRVKIPSTVLKRISKDPDLRVHGIYETVIQICANHVNKPDDFIYREVASFILNVGHPHLAKKYFLLSLQLNPNTDTHSLYLQCLLLDPQVSETELHQVAIQYEKFFSGIEPKKSHKRTLNKDKKLNIGYICHFFYNSVSKSLLLPFLRAHNNERVNIFCYSDAPANLIDIETRGITLNWRDTLDLTNDQLTQMIEDDEIDILLELNGHCFANRYNVIARQAAPVQVSYYNQSGTTGLKSLDYVLIGEDINIDQACYSETIFKMEGVQGISIFPESFPPVSNLPFKRNGYITFGSFGNAHKVNHEVIALWAKLLHKVPNAKLFLKASVLTHTAYKNVYLSMFASYGIHSDRLIIEGHSEHLDMLKRYDDVDIALDTFPHAAGTTTMEALWQGIPVVTICGKRYCSQNGKIVLTAVDHPELIAYTEQEYLDIAIKLANDIPSLEKYRQHLRDDFKKSTLYDAKSFAQRLENAYFKMWAKYCDNHNQLGTANKTVSQ